MQAGPKDKLDSTAVSQPAIYVASLAALEKLKQDEGQVAVIAPCINLLILLAVLHSSAGLAFNIYATCERINWSCSAGLHSPVLGHAAQ